MTLPAMPGGLHVSLPKTHHCFENSFVPASARSDGPEEHAAGFGEDAARGTRWAASRDKVQVGPVQAAALETGTRM